MVLLEISSYNSQESGLLDESKCTGFGLCEENVLAELLVSLRKD